MYKIIKVKMQSVCLGLQNVFIQSWSTVLAYLLPAFFIFSLADDTEIYFSGFDAQQIKPNVLFVVDTSFSLRAAVQDPSGNVLGSRISILQESLEKIISGLRNMNVGIMRMNGADTPKYSTAVSCTVLPFTPTEKADYDPKTYFRGEPGAEDDYLKAIRKTPTYANSCYVPVGGTVLFPVTDLDADASSVRGEPGPKVFSTSTTITSGNDDVVQLGSSSPRFDDKVLQLGTQQCDPGTAPETFTKNSGSYGADIGKTYTGFHFADVGIPNNAKIISAYIEFTASADSLGDVDNLTIIGDQSTSNDPQAYSTLANLQGRITDSTTATVDWTGIEPTKNGGKFQTPDISAIVQEIVDEGSRPVPGPMAFVIDQNTTPGAGSRPITKTETKLVVQYCATLSPVLSAPLSRVTLRFADVRVPQGAKIRSAKVLMTAGPTGLNVGGTGGNATGPENMYVFIENTDDSQPYSPSNTPAARSYGTPERWNGWVVAGKANKTDPDKPDALWTQGDTYQNTPGKLKDLVQSIVNRSGWCGGNAMAFQFTSRVNNDLTRTILSYDADPASAPVLQINYSTTGIGTSGGCTTVDMSLPVSQSEHDGAESNRGNVNYTRPAMSIGNTNQYGFIFSVPLEKNTVIKSAKLQLTAYRDSLASAEIYVNAQATKAADFSTAKNDLSSRPRLNAGKGSKHTVGPVNKDETWSVDVQDYVERALQNPAWVKDSQMAFFIQRSSGGRRVYTYDSDPVKAARLIIKAEQTIQTATPKTVRDRLLEINNTLSNLLGYTPSVETLYEAALYWRGKPVDYGKRRGAARLGIKGKKTPLPSPRRTRPNANFSSKMERTLTSHPGSWTGGAYNRGTTVSGGNCQLSNEPHCKYDYISGNPTYISPVYKKDSLGKQPGICSENYMVFLTDGAPTQMNPSTESKIISEFQGSPNNAFNTCVKDDISINARGQSGRCAVEMVRSLRYGDLDNDDNNGIQNVTTYTIGFNLGGSGSSSVKWLEQIAQAGGGQYRSASTADELIGVFNEFLGQVLEVSTRFASPAITTNFFNRTRSRDEVYYGLFTPRKESKWPGNVKRFRICVDDDNEDDITGEKCTTDQVSNSTILDSKHREAVDSTTLLFKDKNNKDSAGQYTAQSYWSAGPDGNDTVAGGAGAKLTNYKERKIYIDTGPQELTAFVFDSGGEKWDSAKLVKAREAVCGGLSLSDCEKRMLWLLGKDEKDEDLDGSSDDTRWSMGDVIHASPTVVTYGFKDDNPSNGILDSGESLIDKLLVSTNDGSLRMVNTTTGEEDWSFMPRALLETNTDKLYSNSQGEHIYGMDASPVIDRFDDDNDGAIEPDDGDYIHVYQAMRRGGRQLYALDITHNNKLTDSATVVEPKLLWTIDINDPDADGTTKNDYARLGETWSRPVLAEIAVRDADKLVTKKVLVMGGGYDNDLDEHFGTTSVDDPNQGNAIYIIDPKNGKKLLSISGKPPISGIGEPDIKIPGFDYSIVADVTVLDSDGDGLDDRLYVPDTAGNIWRVDLGTDINKSGGKYTGTKPVDKTIIAQIASLSDSSDPAKQRRFYNPVTAVQVVDTKYTDNITKTDNASGKLTYLLINSGYRAHPLDVKVSDYFFAIRDKVANRLIDNDDNHVDDEIYKTPITIGGLYDISNTDSLPLSAASARGYYISFPSKGAVGEKGLGRVAVLNGNVTFTTYVPQLGISADICSSNIGESYAYSFSLQTGESVFDQDQDGDGKIGGAGDRRKKLGSGLASDPIPVFTDQGVKLVVGLQQSVQSLSATAANKPIRTYWYER